MRLTLFGLKVLLFQAALVGAYFATPYSNLFFLLISFLCLVWVVAAAGVWRNGRGVGAEFPEVPMTCQGAAPRVSVALTGGRRARFDVAARMRFGSGPWLEAHADVLDDRAAVEMVLPALPRGVHPVKRSDVTSTHPFGLLRRTNEVQGPTEVIVYPAPSEAGAKARTSRDLLQDLNQGLPVAGGDQQPAGLVDYRPGDPVRAIHWRASARRGKPVICEWDGATDSVVEVLIDRRCADGALEESLAEISALVVLCREGKDRLGLRSQGMARTFGEGAEPWEACLRWLAEADALPMDGPAPPPTSPGVVRLPRRVQDA